METTKNKLSPQEIIFFQNLKNYIELPLYFYGSVQRYDYLPQYSDIDVDIFTNDEKSIIIKLQNFLNVDRNDFKKTIFRIKEDGMVILGYKIKYINEKDKINAEFAIFNEKDKNYIIESQKNKFNLPYLICLLLLFIKILHHKLNLISTHYFRKIKSFIIGMTDEYKTNLVILNIDQQIA
jgi:hypothetical protein